MNRQKASMLCCLMPMESILGQTAWLQQQLKIVSCEKFWWYVARVCTRLGYYILPYHFSLPPSAINVQFDPTGYSAVEGEAAMLTAVLSSAADTEVTVLFSTTDGTAIGNWIHNRAASAKVNSLDVLFSAPGDYTAIVDMVITFPAGQTSVTFPVSTEADSISEVTERFSGILHNPTGGVILAIYFTATVDIIYNSRKPLQK